MLIFKISGITAGVAFVLSLVLGLFSGAGIVILLIKALIFGVLFFALSCFIYWLVAQFLPELLSVSEDELGFPVSGSRVDISVGDTPIVGAFPMDGTESVDDIAGKPSAPARTGSLPLDQRKNAGYNENGEMDGDMEAAGDIPDMGSGGRTGYADALPDMDGITEAIPGSAADLLSTDSFGFDSSTPRRPKSSSRKSEMAGDFNPKELAQAIQTVLKREEKG